jgi:hypothetical protein
MLNECISRINEFHPDIPIVLVNNHSPIGISNIKGVSKVFLSPFSPAGEINAYVVYYRELMNDFDVAIVIHDSMLLRRKMILTSVFDRGIQFIKHFDDHIVHWSKIKEPQNEFNVANGIKSHDDLVMHFLPTDAMKNCYRNKRGWVGCYGIMSIISSSTMKRLVEHANFLGIAEQMKDKRDRMAFESIFSVLLLSIGYNLDILSSSYDGNWKQSGKWMHITDNFEKISKGR